MTGARDQTTWSQWQIGTFDIGDLPPDRYGVAFTLVEGGVVQDEQTREFKVVGERKVIDGRRWFLLSGRRHA